MPVLIMFVLGRPAFPAPVSPSPPNDPIEQLVADGWTVALIAPSSIQPDNGAGLTQGVIGLTHHGGRRTPDDWGALRAWAWGASRAYDYLAKDPDVDPKHIGIEGVSRYGKAALVAMAFDPRFGMVLVGSSGKGGATPYRRNFGEAGSPAGGDAPWLDQQGSYRATVAAGGVFRLLGAKDLGVGDDYALRACRRSASGCSTARSRGASTKAATPTSRTSNTSLPGPTDGWAARIEQEEHDEICFARPDRPAGLALE
jgi:hypothetical protein